MRDAAERLRGEHDFAAFSANPSEERGGTIRTVHSIHIQREDEQLELRFVANGFLYKMVRSLAGFLVDVGRGHHPPEKADDLLARATRGEDVVTAPAHGLILWRVDYARDL